MSIAKVRRVGRTRGGEFVRGETWHEIRAQMIEVIRMSGQLPDSTLKEQLHN
jgi:hypothetical protein